MAEGRIKFINPERKYGFIESTAKGRDVFFHSSCLQNVRFEELKEGTEVEYEWEEDLRGPRATFLKVLECPSNEQICEYRFINPYNFVRYLGRRPLNNVLGDCPPPPHDRYIGLTGRITCKVETKSPLFVSDSHDIKEIQSADKKKHKSYRFFQYNGQPALPASSLRGMVRSVYETITNSCFAAFQVDCSYPLENRLSGAPDELIPARVLELNAEEGALLEMLDCSKNPPQKVPKKPSLIKSGVISMVYNPKVLKHDGSVFDISKKPIPDNLHNGMRVAALVKNKTFNKQRYQFFEVVKIAPVDQHSSLVEEDPDEHAVVFGWLYLTGPNIENKHDERLFFRWSDNSDDSTPDPPQIEQIPESCLHRCTTQVVEEYNHHLYEYWCRHEKRINDLGSRPWAINKRTLPHPSNFIAGDNQLREGDLVYLVRDKDREMLRPVALPRTRYTYHRQFYLPDYLSLCKGYNQLCPACRLFGWVQKSEKESDLEKSVAYAGRVRFSHGEIKKTEGTYGELTLAILFTPKPTATAFYLLAPSGKPDPRVDYNDKNAKLRGRKYYHHHVQLKDYSVKDKGDQNRTVRDALKPGAIFTFNIDFENLNQLELGALIYALELEEEMFHRLGFGKPLGFGSVAISIEKIVSINWKERLTSTAPMAGWSEINGNVAAELKKEFLNAICNIYGKEFTCLQSELKAILGKQDLPIHYPRPTRQSDPQRPSFEWFVGNKRRMKKTPGPVALPLATEIEMGLPLIDKNGNPG